MSGFLKQTIKDVDLTNKRVLVRADYNVPLDDHGQVTDDYRITQSLPTLQHLVDQNCKVVVVSHLGRPQPNANNMRYSLAPVVVRLKKLMPKVDIDFIDDCVGEDVQTQLKKRKRGTITILENLRFYTEETGNSDDFAQKLAKHADVFVQDGFGVAHRAQASTDAITNHLKSYAGLLLEKEVVTISAAMENPERPFMAIVGGAKISDKIGILKTFIDKADKVAVVGAMANTFLLAQGHKVGSSLVEKDKVDVARQIIKMAEDKPGFELYIPGDYVVSTSLEGDKPTSVVDLSNHVLADINAYPKQPDPCTYQVADNQIICDIGPVSASYIAGLARGCKTLVWNGTGGITEAKGINGAAAPFSHGSNIIADALLRAGGPFTIVGGGDTVGYVEGIPGAREKLGHVSTGGGASMELMSGLKLPGVEALLDKD